MKSRVLLAVISIPALMVAVSAQRPADAPATGGGKPPDTVLLEELTWAEVRDLMAAGTTTVIIGTAGTEQKGPHMVDGEHKFVMDLRRRQDRARDRARRWSRRSSPTCPRAAGSRRAATWASPARSRCPKIASSSCWSTPAAASRPAASRRSCSSASRAAIAPACAPRPTRLNELWKGAATALLDRRLLHQVARRSEQVHGGEVLGVPEDQIGDHANILDTSELLFVAPKHVRRDRLPGNDYENNGVSGDQPGEVVARARQGQFLQIKIDNALAQIKRMLERQPSRPCRRCPPRPPGGGGGGRGGAGVRRTRRRPPAGPTVETAPAGKTPTKAPDTVFIDELTWEENARRDEGRQDHGHRPDRRHREERVPHGARQAQLRRHPRRQPDGAPAEERAGRADDSVRARGRSRSPEPGRDLAAVAGLRHAARRRGAQPQGARLHRHPVHRRQRRQSGRHDRGRQEAERGVEGRRHEGLSR